MTTRRSTMKKSYKKSSKKNSDDDFYEYLNKFNTSVLNKNVDIEALIARIVGKKQNMYVAFSIDNPELEEDLGKAFSQKLLPKQKREDGVCFRPFKYFSVE